MVSKETIVKAAALAAGLKVAYDLFQYKNVKEDRKETKDTDDGFKTME